MSSTHNAALFPAPGHPLTIKDVETHHPEPNQVLIRNYAIAIQPLDAKMLITNYGPAASLAYPAVLGSSGAGVVEQVGSSVTHLQVGDRVVFDTAAYVRPEVNMQQGTWQQLVVCSADTVAKIGKTPFSDAVLASFPLQTAVAALRLFLGMQSPSPSTPNKPSKVLIWGAGGAVGQAAVQYAVSLGYTVVATASPHSTSTLMSLGVSTVLDYRSPSILSSLLTEGPFEYLMTASGDPESQRVMIELLRPTGGRFVSVLPLGEGVSVPEGVEVVYTAFSQAAQRDEYAAWRGWWYGVYFPEVVALSAASPVGYKIVEGGLKELQEASQGVFDGKVRGKIIINPQE